jgi:hypothetical protein
MSWWPVRGEVEAQKWAAQEARECAYFGLLGTLRRLASESDTILLSPESVNLDDVFGDTVEVGRVSDRATGLGGGRWKRELEWKRELGGGRGIEGAAREGA